MNANYRYLILSADDWQALENKVNSFVKSGWAPAGGVFVEVHPHVTTYWQAIWLPPDVAA